MSLKTSEQIKNISMALHKAQMEIGAAKKDSANPFFKSRYADLGAVMEVTKEPLNKHGIFIIQPATHKDGKNFITTRLVHAESGEWFESDTEIVCAKQNDPQAKLAAETYTRRGALQAMLFVPAEDDDGNTASGRKLAEAAKSVANSLPSGTASSASSFRKGAASKSTPVGATLTESEPEWT